MSQKRSRSTAEEDQAVRVHMNQVMCLDMFDAIEAEEEPFPWNSNTSLIRQQRNAIFEETVRQSTNWSAAFREAGVTEVSAMNTQVRYHFSKLLKVHKTLSALRTQYKDPVMLITAMENSIIIANIINLETKFFGSPAIILQAREIAERNIRQRFMKWHRREYGANDLDSLLLEQSNVSSNEKCGENQLNKSVAGDDIITAMSTGLSTSVNQSAAIDLKSHCSSAALPTHVSAINAETILMPQSNSKKMALSASSATSAALTTPTPPMSYYESYIRDLKKGKVFEQLSKSSRYISNRAFNIGQTMLTRLQVTKIEDFLYLSAEELDTFASLLVEPLEADFRKYFLVK